MSQNFSTMSDIFIPELIELDTFWEKAVEDAIRDTLKGEKRLHQALRNRKKINEKLEKLGLKGVLVRNVDDYARSDGFGWTCKGKASTAAKSKSRSRGLESASSREEGPASEGQSDLDTRSLHAEESPPPPKRNRNPERPLLGDGSLEKMKKSQNSFNCEPMGTDDGFLSRDEAGSMESEAGTEKPRERTEESETERSRSFHEERTCNSDNVSANDKNYNGKNNNKIEWLHVREDSNFEDSDAETPRKRTPEKFAPNDSYRKRGMPDDAESVPDRTAGKFSMKNAWDKRKEPKPGNSKTADEDFSMMLDPKMDSFWENEVKNAIRENTNMERKLCLALAKRDIVNENLRNLKMENGNYKIRVTESQVRFTEKRRKNRKLLSPFVRFYLEVYGELCHRLPIQDIAKEAANRWWSASGKQKSQT